MTLVKAIQAKSKMSYLSAGVVLTALPDLAWSHPGHGLEGLLVHDMLHGATATVAIALVTIVTVRFIRSRKQKTRSR